ncbi:hypothetical protein WA538_003884 [Blastocystis sp. DL]
MSATAEQAPTPVDVVSKPAEKKNTSALIKIKRAIGRFKKTNFVKRINDAINFVVNSSWSLGKKAGRLCWVAGCLAVIILFPLAMEVDREQTMMEIQNRERERMTRPHRI